MLNAPPCFILRIAHLPSALHASAITPTREKPNPQTYRNNFFSLFHLQSGFPEQSRNHIEFLVDPHPSTPLRASLITDRVPLQALVNELIS